MANLTQIIGGQPYYSATAGNEKNNLLDFWKGTQAQYNALKKTSAILATAPTSATSLAFTGFTAPNPFVVGDSVYVTGTTGSNTTRTVATVTAIPTATSVTVSIAAYTSTATTGYTIDSYLPETVYLITAT
jgi:hypothetical protein